MSKQDIEKRLGFAAQGVKVEMASGWSGKSAKLNRYGNFAVVAAGEDGYAKGFANRTQAQAFSDKHNLGGVKFPSSGGRSFYVFMEAPKDSESTTAARPGAKAKMAASDIIVKKDAQYIYYYPEDDDRATFPDDNGKGAYTVKSNRTGKPVSAKTYRSLQEAVSASNAMNEKLPPLKKAKAARPGSKAKA
jgi:hypothetical protein